MRKFIVSAVALVCSLGASMQAMANEQSQLILAQAPHLKAKVLKTALHKFEEAKADIGSKIKKDILTVIDYTMPSNQKRLWVIDLDHDKVLYNSLVAHGKYSGALYARHFSDRDGSLESSIGTFLTEGTYYGHDGYAMKIDGLEKGFNDTAEKRHVVMHGAWYVSRNMIKRYGRIGRSWGCPALPEEKLKPVVNTIKNGSVLVAYYPNHDWLDNSQFAV
ncbi:MAG: murein L,D-transpeptidase catalytic domain family protein [Gammaproteobacteria bacterium]|nr:murein L,D-transpeptidase catalytic domain family protein [Gammaproteobacteria bacterium]